MTCVSLRYRILHGYIYIHARLARPECWLTLQVQYAASGQRASGVLSAWFAGEHRPRRLTWRHVDRVYRDEYRLVTIIDWQDTIPPALQRVIRRAVKLVLSQAFADPAFHHARFLLYLTWRYNLAVHSPIWERLRRFAGYPTPAAINGIAAAWQDACQQARVIDIFLDNTELAFRYAHAQARQAIARGDPAGLIWAMAFHYTLASKSEIPPEIVPVRRNTKQ